MSWGVAIQLAAEVTDLKTELSQLRVAKVNSIIIAIIIAKYVVFRS